MTGSGWRQELGDLARNAMRVLFVYALLLQTLVPLAVAQASDDSGGPPFLCSVMAGAEHPAQAPARSVHDCLFCCLGSAVGVMAAPVELPAPTGFSLPLARLAPKVLVLPAPTGRSPSQRAPPRLA